MTAIYLVIAICIFILCFMANFALTQNDSKLKWLKPISLIPAIGMIVSAEWCGACMVIEFFTTLFSSFSPMEEASRNKLACWPLFHSLAVLAVLVFVFISGYRDYSNIAFKILAVAILISKVVQFFIFAKKGLT